ncbi:MAG TPA: allantoinase AllB [Candidatus Dormibacteraeota bacterium]|nr:allantoinase AllB [Candidatus Dormibacteraeota bacterium]
MIVRGGTVVSSRGLERADISITSDGVIAAVGRDLEADGEEIDASGLHVFPGGIDSHVHFNEPGRTEWEDIAHGSAALAAGGYTAFIDMPLNNLPVTTTIDAFDVKLQAMQRSSRVDFGLWAGLVPGNLDDIEPLVARGAMGFKAFMCPSGIDEFPACDEATLREGMERIAEANSILLVHAEDPALLREPAGPSGADFAASRPPEAELAAIETVVRLSRDTGCRAHIVHVSTPQGAALLGGGVSGETCPQYMLFTEADLERLGGMGKCAPPLRAARMQAMPIIVSDHSPSTLDLKQGDDFRKIWGGISGCQTTRGLLLGMDFDPASVAAITATNVARRFRIARKGDIAPGFDADLWLMDLGHEGVVRQQDLLYKNPFSAFEGEPIRGRTVMTLVHGEPPSPGLGRMFGTV